LSTVVVWALVYRSSIGDEFDVLSCAERQIPQPALCPYLACHGGEGRGRTAGVWVDGAWRQREVVKLILRMSDCSCIFNNHPCKSKPSELNCYSDCRDCYTDRWQWQIMVRRKVFGSVRANTITELELFLNGFHHHHIDSDLH
jgi:hypothetical protein